MRNHLCRLVMLVAVVFLATATAVALESRDSATARGILRRTGVQGGLVVHLGCDAPGAAARTGALRTSGAFLVQGLARDPARVAEIRERLVEAGAYGPVSVLPMRGTRLPYADNLVHLLVAEDLADVPMAEVRRVLAPRGVACVKQGDGWGITVKPWPDTIDAWTHWMHNASGNMVARDTVAGPPRRLQWVGRPLWSRHHNFVPSVTSQVTANGRLFYIVDEAPSSMTGTVPDQWWLVARDAFSGIELWRRPIPTWGWSAWSETWQRRFTVPTNIQKRLVAVGDRVYVTLDYNAPLTELDAATGEVVREFPDSDYTDEILVTGGKVLVALNQEPQRPGEKADPVRKSVAAYDTDSGRRLWKTGDYVGLQSKHGSMNPITHLAMVAGDGRIFLVDRDRLVCLSMDDGRTLWTAPRPKVPPHEMRYHIRITDMCTLVYHDGVLVFAQLNPDRRIDWREIRGRAHVYDAPSGKELWTQPCASWGWGHPADVFVREGLVWLFNFTRKSKATMQPRGSPSGEHAGKAFIIGYNPRTGEEQRRVCTHKAFDFGHHHRCYRNKATERYLLTSFRGYEFTDWKSGAVSLNHWVRGTCRIGGFPCNGLLYTNPHPCECYITAMLNGVLALAPAAESPPAPAEPPRPDRGPAYADKPAADTQATEADWPVFRHDAHRTGCTEAAVPANLEPAWKADLADAPLTACIAADGIVFTACPTASQLVALAADRGEVRWRFTAHGGVDTPPTWRDGRLYFGCRAGYVYCLDARTGRLAWRTRAAPRDRLIVAFGRVESAWPVHGSVLVRDGKVYAVAGRSSFLDGGIHACVLDTATGRVIERRVLRTDYDIPVDTGHTNLVAYGCRADLLVVHDGRMYMRQNVVFPADEGEDAQRKPHKTDAADQHGGPVHSLAGFLDDSFFSRTRWYLGGQPYGEYLVFDDQRVYGVRARNKASADGGFFNPRKDPYVLFSAGRRTGGKAGKAKPDRKDWAVKLPTRVEALARAGDVLFAAGVPNAVPEKDPWAAYEGHRGGHLYAVARGDGSIIAKRDLDQAPVYDGLSAARGRLYLATRQGSLLCFE